MNIKDLKEYIEQLPDDMEVEIYTKDYRYVSATLLGIGAKADKKVLAIGYGVWLPESA